MNLKKEMTEGFTLIELMIVMSIVALLMGMVGPLAINSLEKAQAKQEMLSINNWLRKIAFRAFSTGHQHIVNFSGKNVVLYSKGKEKEIIENKSFQTLFFQPQQLIYTSKGFVSPGVLIGSYRGKPLSIDLKVWVNNESELTNEHNQINIQ
tara:strand:- start:23939 stop:24391 length:453 start_codon:yes stop_codon:yes gene_type:complete